MDVGATVGADADDGSVLDDALGAALGDGVAVGSGDELGDGDAVGAWDACASEAVDDGVVPGSDAAGDSTGSAEGNGGGLSTSGTIWEAIADP